MDLRWIQSFTHRFNTVNQSHKGKYLLSPEKGEWRNVSVAAQIGTMSALLTSGQVSQGDIENAYETHFIINVDNGKTLGFSGSGEVRYADVVSGGEGFPMVFRLSGGEYSLIQPPILVFANKNRNYPIRGTPDNVDGVSYRSGQKGRMETSLIPQWITEPRVIGPLSGSRRQVLYVENWSGHAKTDLLNEACRKIRTDMKYFPPNATHLIQPRDSFVIQKQKQCW